MDEINVLVCHQVGTIEADPTSVIRKCADCGCGIWVMSKNLQLQMKRVCYGCAAESAVDATEVNFCEIDEILPSDAN